MLYLSRIENYSEQLKLSKPNFNLLKRLFDLFFASLIILTVIIWLLPVLAILIKLTSKGPVFFKQLRTGKNGRSFICWKFRTMYVNSSADIRQASESDYRITPVGKFLRKFSLDELPQFFNVIAGNMSVVGPRPHMIKHTNDYEIIYPLFTNRHLVKPGITGLSQIRGYRGEVKDNRMLINRVRLDLFYIYKWNFLLDLLIIQKTIKMVFLGDKNAY